MSDDITVRIAEAYATGQTHVVTFHRKDGWYPIELPLDPTLAMIGEHAERNPGTLYVKDYQGNTLWCLQ